MGATMFKRLVDVIWNKFFMPVADLFWPANDCAVCYFWRAFLVGAIAATTIWLSIFTGFLLGLAHVVKL